MLLMNLHLWKFSIFFMCYPRAIDWCMCLSLSQCRSISRRATGPVPRSRPVRENCEIDRRREKWYESLPEKWYEPYNTDRMVLDGHELRLVKQGDSISNRFWRRHTTTSAAAESQRMNRHACIPTCCCLRSAVCQYRRLRHAASITDQTLLWSHKRS